MATGSNGPAADTLVDIQAIKSCLEELENHAAANGIPLAANLIGAASRAIADEIAERKFRRANPKHRLSHMFDA